MAENGEDKLIAMARHIAKTLGRTETMTDDILQIFSTFDGRFSRERLSENLDFQDGGGGTDDGHHVPSFPTTLDCTFRSLHRQISRFVASDRPIWSDAADSAAFLDAVDALLAAIRDLDTAMTGDKALIDYADDLLQQTMLRLEDEFRSLVEQQDVVSSPLDPVSAQFSSYESDGDETEGDDRIPVAQPVADYDIVIDALPSGSIADLHEIAKRMVAAGYGKECAHAYCISRRDFLEESISRLGLRPRTTEEVQGTPWPDLEDEIGRWIRAMNVAVRILFPSERRLCDRVFAGLAPVTELSFAEVCRGPAIQLLGFADAVAIGSRAPERLFRTVDMFEAVRDLMLEIDLVFSDQYCSFLRSEAESILKRLGTAIRAIFMELENLIRRDPAKAGVPGGGLHPITRYVMNYLRAACASRRTLEEVMEEEEGRALPLADQDSPSSSLSVQVAWVMELLQGNLEAKSKVYRDPSLSCVFLMNNGRYIIQKVSDCELGPLLGEDWIRRQIARQRQWHSGYQRSTWSKVIAALRIDGGGGSSSSSSTSITAKVVKEKFRMFNQYMEEICRTQAEWVVADEQLRTELRSSIAGSVLPVYQNFLVRLRNAVEAGKHGERYVNYSAKAVESRINELFQGTGKR